MAEKYQLHRQVYEMLKETEEPGLGMIAKWLGGVICAVDEGKPILYHGFTSFTEIMVALDIQTLCCEAWDIVGVQVDQDHVIKSVDAAHEAGIPPELCSFDKAIIGSIIREVIPPPAMIVASLMPCQNSVIAYQAIGQLTGAPLWVTDTPYDMDEDGAMEYWLRQYKGVISFLEEHSGKKMDYDRLKEVVEESNRCVEYWLDAVELQKLKPSPRSGTISVGTQAGITSFGTPEGTAAVKGVLDEIKGRVARGETEVPDEKVRVIWFQLPVFWDNTLLSWMAEMGAVVPFVLFDDYRVEPVDTSTPESMLRGMAKRAVETPMGRVGRGGYDLVIEDVLYAVEEFKGDCVIFASHPSCKWMSGGFGLMRDTCRERGIPVLMYDVDLVDRRITSAEESRTRIEQFLTTVMAR